MGVPRTLGTVSSVNSQVVPVYTGKVTAAISFSILNNIATIVLGKANFPTNGYNGPNGYPGLSGTPDIHGGIAWPGDPAGGQQVTLWGFATATYFNAKTVTVLDCDPVAGSFRFRFTHANVASTADTGSTAIAPTEHFRVVRIECAQTLGTDLVYVGDLNVSTTQYVTALSLTGQLAIEIASDNIPADRIFILGSNGAGTDSVVVSVIY